MMMTLTKKELEEKYLHAKGLEEEVLKYVLEQWDEYRNKKRIFEEVLRYGCVSGIVSDLIYYSDTIPFYEKHKDEINNLLQELGLTPSNLNNWDDDDPLALDTHNQNLLAWLGFEEKMREVYDELEYEYYIPESADDTEDEEVEENDTSSI